MDKNHFLLKKGKTIGNTQLVRYRFVIHPSESKSKPKETEKEQNEIKDTQCEKRDNGHLELMKQYQSQHQVCSQRCHNVQVDQVHY